MWFLTIRPLLSRRQLYSVASKDITPKDFPKDAIRTKNKISDFEDYEAIAYSKIKNKRQVLRNCVLPELGKYLLEELTK